MLHRASWDLKVHILSNQIKTLKCSFQIHFHTKDTKKSFCCNVEFNSEVVQSSCVETNDLTYSMVASQIYINE